MRNEKLHKQLHNDFVSTLDETIKMIDMWLNFKNSQPCPNAPNKTIAEILGERRRQNKYLFKISECYKISIVPNNRHGI